MLIQPFASKPSSISTLSPTSRSPLRESLPLTFTFSPRYTLFPLFILPPMLEKISTRTSSVASKSPSIITCSPTKIRPSVLMPNCTRHLSPIITSPFVTIVRSSNLVLSGTTKVFLSKAIAKSVSNIPL